MGLGDDNWKRAHGALHYSPSDLDGDKASIYPAQKFVKMHTYDLCILPYVCYAHMKYTLKRKVKIHYHIQNRLKMQIKTEQSVFSPHIQNCKLLTRIFFLYRYPVTHLLTSQNALTNIRYQNKKTW